MRSNRKQSGDTIVELMMAIVILATVLMAAFLLSQRSASTVRNSQEQAEMNQVLSTQVELLRAMALTQGAGSSIYRTTPSTYFCVDNTDGLKRVDFDSGFALPSTSVSAVSYPSQCKSGPDGRYNIAIKYAANGIFTVDGRWDSIGGGLSTTSFKYRIPQ